MITILWLLVIIGAIAGFFGVLAMVSKAIEEMIKRRP